MSANRCSVLFPGASWSIEGSVDTVSSRPMINKIWGLGRFMYGGMHDGSVASVSGSWSETPGMLYALIRYLIRTSWDDPFRRS